MFLLNRRAWAVSFTSGCLQANCGRAAKRVMMAGNMLGFVFGTRRDGFGD
jgi:hypothetical protein